MSHPTCCCSVSLHRCDRCDLLVGLVGFHLMSVARTPDPSTPTRRISGLRARYRVNVHSEGPTYKRACVPLAPVLTWLLAHVDAGAARELRGRPKLSQLTTR